MAAKAAAAAAAALRSLPSRVRVPLDLGADGMKLPSAPERAKAQFKRNSIYTAYFMFGGLLSYALVKPTLDRMKDNAEAVSGQREKMKNDIIQHMKEEFETLTVEIEQIISDKIPEAKSTETSGHGKEHAHQVE
ncbi:hypothetical protein U9M48_034516 [Paspalum notatum var. saurae]|uniref:Uncharacterized protein n=1 Tax=Paspalum notatum var. saurae TaxID=547442 RepID=A0AAQ3X8Z8_PASNO